MNKLAQILGAIGILVAGVAVFGLMIVFKREIPKSELKVLPPMVRFVKAAPGDRAMKVRVHGTVMPRTESTLVPQVSGRVIEVSTSFDQGGFFGADEILLKVDPTDYKLAVAQAKARVAQAKMRLSREEAEAKLAREEWESYGKGDPDPLVLREPQLAEARAALASAEAAVAQAKLNLDRTEIRAPYAGRIREKYADVGQTVSPGTAIARCYGVDFAEVRLPVPLEELDYLNLPLNYRGEASREGPEVVLKAKIGRQEHTWHARIVRTEAEIDPRTRMLRAVARIEDPYARGTYDARPPLMVGLFVEAEILGRKAEGVFVLPRSAIRNGTQVLIIDAEDRLRVRDVKILRFEGEEALVQEGIEAGERICVSPLEIATDGMKIRVHEEGDE